MQFKFLAIITLITLVTVGCVKDADYKQVGSEIQPGTTVANTTTAKIGSFTSGEKPTQGAVKVITEQGKRYLEFDQNFKTNNGPDLFVILYRDNKVPVSGIKEQDYLRIARLQKTIGTQRYNLPENVKLEDFKSVAIWCRAFNATFGYAPFSI